MISVLLEPVGRVDFRFPEAMLLQVAGGTSSSLFVGLVLVDYVGVGYVGVGYVRSPMV